MDNRKLYIKFNDKFRFNNVRNKISDIIKDNKNNFRKKRESLKVLNQVHIATFHPLPELLA